MAVKRVKPPLKDPSGKGIIRRKVKPIVKKSQTGPIFDRLTVVWVQGNGVPFNTTGFFARAFSNGRLVQTASFDRFGVVRFNNIRTLTNRTFVLRVFNAFGVQFRVRVIPAGVETFAIIG
ncbi:hypothetical protein [Paenibacillus pinihumi]|uniref:hypothetical protein n=1 Tax=Paenibacillus pinihumi TaxID=669462 RepID=UPI000419B798|nr:hypothetical protein [Paenibacillus pinihumi]